MYVFELSGSTWVQTAKLVGSDTAAGDRFGLAVSACGDRILIGAPLKDSSAADSGAAYVFERTPAGWSETAILSSPTPSASDLFGIAVSLSAGRAAIGAPGDGVTGATFIFDVLGSIWTQTAKLMDSNGGFGASFGSSVSLDGDVVLIGALQNGDIGPFAGVAYVFKHMAGAWFEDAKLIGSDTTSGDFFGVSVSLDAGTALVGAFHHDPGVVGAGAAYAFEDSGMGWFQKAKFVASDAGVDDALGEAVAIAADTVLTGARLDDDKGVSAGAAYVFCVDACPPLVAGPLVLSAGAGGTHAFQLDAGADMALDLYVLLGTLSGTAPGIPVDSFVLPLNLDSYTVFTLQSPSAAPLAGSFGVLDVSGTGSASFTLPAGASPSLVGTTFHHAFLVLDPALALTTFVSNAVPLTILP